MLINTKDYCNNKKCPLHIECEFEVYRISSVYLKVTITDGDEIEFAVPCLMCKDATRLDFGNIIGKMVTKKMLRQGPDTRIV